MEDGIYPENYCPHFMYKKRFLKKAGKKRSEPICSLVFNRRNYDEARCPHRIPQTMNECEERRSAEKNYLKPEISKIVFQT